MTTEKHLETKLRDSVKALGGWALKFPAVYQIGIPDRLLLMPGGRAFFAEVKRPGAKPRDSQLAVHVKLRKLGFTVFIIDSNETLAECLQKITSTTTN